MNVSSDVTLSHCVSENFLQACQINGGYVGLEQWQQYQQNEERCPLQRDAPLSVTCANARLARVESKSGSFTTSTLLMIDLASFERPPVQASSSRFSKTSV